MPRTYPYPDRPMTWYRTTHPDALAFLREWDHREAAFDAALMQVRGEFPQHEVAFFSQPMQRFAEGLLGECPGPCWSRKGRNKYWSPLRNTSEGRRCAALLYEVSLDVPEAPGMPHGILWGEPYRFHWPLFQVTTGPVLWAFWRLDRALIENEKFDPSIWARVSTSEFWLAREADEAIDV